MSNPVGALGSITQGIFGGPNQNQAAPTIDTSGTNAWQGNPGNVAGNEAAQQQAIAMAQRTAAGQGPSAATSLLNEQTKQAQAQAGAMAASGQGSTGQALARRDAMMAGANATQELGGQAATARAQEQLGGEQLAGSLASGARGQDLTAAGQQAGLAQSQGQLQEQQNQTNAQSATSNATSAGNTLTSMAGMAAGALMFADGDARGTPPGGARVGTSNFKEPGGAAEWTLREEDNFLLAVNRRTGQRFKVAMQHLTPAEEREAQAPHGAGPIDAPPGQRAAKQMADGDLGSDPRFAQLVRAAHPGLYRAASAGGSYADGDMGTEGEWARATELATNAAGMGKGDEGEYGKGWDDVIHARGGSAPGDPDAPSPAQSGKGGALAGALLGWSNPGALGKIAAARASSAGKGYQRSGPTTTDAPPPEAPPSTYTDALGNTAHYGDADLSEPVMAGFRKIEGARAAYQAPAAMDAVARMRREALSDIEAGPNLARSGGGDDTTRLLKDRAPRARVVLDSERNGRELEGLGLGSGRVPTESGGYAPSLVRGSRGYVDVSRGGQHASMPMADIPSSAEAAVNRRAFAPAAHEYQDADLGSRDNPVDLDDPVAVQKASEQLADRARPGSSANPVDIDAWKPDIDIGDRGFGGRDAPVDLDDPMAVWDAEMRLSEPARRRYEAAEIAAMNPYETKPTPARAPALATLFSVPKSKPNAGPTDFLSVMRARGRAFDRAGGLRSAAQDWERDQAAEAEAENTLNRRGFDLVPGEAEGINLKEARRRTKSRNDVRALMRMWADEARGRPRGPENDEREMVASYPDADLSPKRQKASALGRTMARKGKKGRRAAA